MSKKTVITSAVVAGLLGIGVGASASGDTSATPEPTETITETVEVEVPGETVTEEVEVVHVPEACVSALNEADVIMDRAGDAMMIAAEGMEAAFYQDGPGMESVGSRLDELTALNNQSLYPVLRDECLNAATAANLG